MSFKSKLTKIFSNKYFIYLLLFICTFIIFYSNVRYNGSIDTRINELYAQNFARTGKLYLEEPIIFEGQEKPGRFADQAPANTEVDGKYYSKYPIATSILVSPIFKFLDLIGFNSPYTASKFSAVLITSISVVILFATLKKLSSSKVALLISLIYAFGTATWGTTSQAVWQHTTSQFISIVVLYLFSVLLTDNSKVNKWWVFCLIGFLLALNFIIRPTNLLAYVLFLGLIVLTRDKKNILLTIVSGIPVILLLFIYNYTSFGSFLSTGYSAEAGNGWTNNIFTGIYGLLFSPSVGLIVFSPVLIFSFWGIYHYVKNAIQNFSLKFDNHNFFLVCILVFLLNMIVYSAWWAWHGDIWTYRMLLDALPYLILTLIYPIQTIFSKLCSSNILYRFLLLPILILSILFSFYFQFIGAFAFDYSWRGNVRGLHEDNKYLFDIQNSQLAHYLTNQRYYFYLPRRNAYVINDKFGSEVSFDKSIQVKGEEKYLHAFYAEIGRNPEIINDRLVLEEGEGFNFFINEKYRNSKFKLIIEFEEFKGKLRILQIRNSAIMKENFLEIKESDKFHEIELSAGIEEVRVINTEIQSIRVKSVRVEKLM